MYCRRVRTTTHSHTQHAILRPAVRPSRGGVVLWFAASARRHRGRKVHCKLFHHHTTVEGPLSSYSEPLLAFDLRCRQACPMKPLKPGPATQRTSHGRRHECSCAAPVENSNARATRRNIFDQFASLRIKSYCIRQVRCLAGELCFLHFADV